MTPAHHVYLFGRCRRRSLRRCANGSTKWAPALGIARLRKTFAPASSIDWQAGEGESLISV